MSKTIVLTIVFMLLVGFLLYTVVVFDALQKVSQGLTAYKDSRLIIGYILYIVGMFLFLASM